MRVTVREWFRKTRSISDRWSSDPTSRVLAGLRDAMDLQEAIQKAPRPVGVFVEQYDPWLGEYVRLLEQEDKIETEMAVEVERLKWAREFALREAATDWLTVAGLDITTGLSDGRILEIAQQKAPSHTGNVGESGGGDV